MEELKKTIIDNLYRTNFYEALKNIKQLEVNFPNKEEIEIQNQINITDKEIDQMVYKLYDLTEDEIKIVEGI